MVSRVRKTKCLGPEWTGVGLRQRTSVTDSTALSELVRDDPRGPGGTGKPSSW